MIDRMSRVEGAPLGALLRVGLVEKTDYETGRLRCKIPDLDDFLTPWLFVLLPKTGSDKAFWMPEKGEQVAVLLDAEARIGFVLGAIYSTADTIPDQVDKDSRWHVQFADGTTIDYDRQTSTMTIHCVGDITIQSDKTLTLKGADIALDNP